MTIRTQSENPKYLSVTAQENTTDNVCVDAASNAEFFLGHSLTFGFEWEIEGTNDVSADCKLQMKTSDGTWIDARNGDTASGTATNSIFTAEAALARGFTTLSPPFSVNAFRVVCDNNSLANDLTFKIWVHRTFDKVR